MKQALRVVALFVFAFPVGAADWHHLHFSATDTAKAAQWYAKYFGGEAVKFGPLDVVMMEKTAIAFQQLEEGFEGSEGSSVDHVGFSVDDIDAAMKRFEEDGVKITQPVRAIGPIKFGFIEDPWGTKLEIIQDPETPGFHHVHLHSPDPEGTLEWYAEAFGGEIAKFKGLLPAINYNDVWLLVQRSEAKEPTQGRAIDHLGWSFADVDKAVEELQANGVKITVEPQDFMNLRIAFIEGPDGVRIELATPAAGQ